jgi:hypothetical protein
MVMVYISEKIFEKITQRPGIRTRPRSIPNVLLMSVDVVFYETFFQFIRLGRYE